MERYKLEIVNDHGDRYIRCEPATDGSWVMFKDVAALEARIAQLEAALKRIEDTDPDEGTPWFHEVARAALAGGKDE